MEEWLVKVVEDKDEKVDEEVYDNEEVESDKDDEEDEGKLTCRERVTSRGKLYFLFFIGRNAYRWLSLA